MLKRFEKRLWDLERFGFTPGKIHSRFSNKPSSLRPLAIISVPKSGTHLLERILCLVPEIYRPMIRTLNVENISRAGGWGERIAALRPGQLLVTHCHYSAETSEFLRNNNVAGFFMVRDPRAIVLSNAHYMRRSTKHPLHGQVKNFSTEETIEYVLHNPIGHNREPLLDTLRRYLAWGREPGVLTLKFEDFISASSQDKSEIVRKIMEHAGLSLDSTSIKNIAENSISTASPTFRSANTDEWKNVLNSEQLNFIKDSVGEQMRGLGYDI